MYEDFSFCITGNLHFQLHGLDGTGQAFLTGEPMPLRTWIHIVLTVEDEKVQFLSSLKFAS